MGWFHRGISLTAACVFALFPLPALKASSGALALQQRMIDVYEQHKGAVVRVKAVYRDDVVVDPGAKPRVTLRVGTGFFISKEGHVLVSASRAEGASRVWVEYQGRSYLTEEVGHDRLTNLSIMKLVDLPEEFSVIQIDTNVPEPELGAIAFAITCPLDLDPSPAMGLITGKDKRLGAKIFPTEYIRSSISVDAGQGGCPMLDINGRFVGMSVAAIPEINGSYILPVDALVRVRDDLMLTGQVIHSWMGFEVSERLQADEGKSVKLSKVVEGGPADLAGLLKGDELLSIGGRNVRDVSDVPGAVFFTRANQFTTIRVLRDNEEQEFSVKTLPRPEKDDLIGSSETEDIETVVEAALSKAEASEVDTVATDVDHSNDLEGPDSVEEVVSEP